jgi:AhpD family alkylhydroperoxidase
VADQFGLGGPDPNMAASPVGLRLCAKLGKSRATNVEMLVQKYQRRFYRHPFDLLQGVGLLMRERKQIRALRSGKLIDRAFQERLILAVTEVNGCRYCAYAHARLALAAGLTRCDIEALAEGNLLGSPPEQIPALLYARHWAENDASPDPDARQRVLETYGQEKTEAIELSMRMIRVGNLLGNTWDYIMYRVSFGRWGNARH